MQTLRVDIGRLTVKGKIDSSDALKLKKHDQSPVNRMKKEEAERQKRLKEPELSKLMNRTIRLEVDRETNTVVAKVNDRDTGEVIRQIPPEELQRIAKSLEQAGLLLNREA